MSAEKKALNVLPPLIAGCCLLVYWGTVVRNALRFTRKESHGVNLIPRERVGRWVRALWIPTIVAWCVQPWFALRHYFHFSTHSLTWTVTGFIGAAVCISATIATFSCWREMGRSWRIGIDPEEKTQLIFSGPFRVVRHPIYTLSIFLVLGTLATTPTLVMLVIAIVHIACLQFEARREETYLLGKHGRVYADYMKRVGRFLPLTSSFMIDESSSR
jgi:protein-S-isoprenylcysteine O-methyltransferase Ste14